MQFLAKDIDGAIIFVSKAAGHGSQILIADANFPVSTATPATAARVYLNLRPGQVSADGMIQSFNHTAEESF